MAWPSIELSESQDESGWKLAQLVAAEALLNEGIERHVKSIVPQINPETVQKRPTAVKPQFPALGSVLSSVIEHASVTHH